MTVNHRRWFAYEMAFGAQRPGEAFAVALYMLGRRSVRS
jgi:hypothetical protein